MEEEQGKPPEEEKKPGEKSSDSTLASVERIEQATERLENENRRLEKNMAEMKLRDADAAVEGRAAANVPPAKDSDAEYAEKALKGEIGNVQKEE